MKIETVGEQRERMLRENAQHKVPGRTLPRNCQWTGHDQPGCGAVKRRLRQQAKREGHKK